MDEITFKMFLKAREHFLNASNSIHAALDELEKIKVRHQESGNQLPSGNVIKYSYFTSADPILCHCGETVVVCKCSRGISLTNRPQHGHCIGCNQIYDIITLHPLKPVPS